MLATLPFMVWAQEIFHIETDDESLTLEPKHIEIYCDSLNTLGYEDALELSGFSRLNPESIREPGRTYWLRFRIRNHLPRQKNFAAFLGKSDFVALYQFDPVTGTYEERKNGRRVSYHEKDIQGFINYGNYVRLFVPRDTTLTFVVKTRNEKDFFVSDRFIVSLYNEQGAFTHQYYYNIIGAAFIGGLIVMALYTLVLAISIGDRGYFLYMAFILFGLLFYIYFYGFGIEWIWPNAPVWDIYSFLGVLSGTFFFWALFTREYLDTRKNLPLLNKALLFMALVNWIPSFLAIYDYLGSDSPYLLIKIQTVQNFIGLATMLLILYTAVVAYLKRVEHSRFFLGANMAMLLGSIVLSLRFFGVVPQNIVTSNAAQFGFFLQLILFSYGMGSRINRMEDTIAMKEIEKIKLKQEKEEEKTRLIEEKNRELQIKVDERTEELLHQAQLLEDKSKQLESQNSELKDLNRHKDLLFSIIGHDLRNPLANIKGVLALMKEGLLSKEEMAQINTEVEKSIESVLTMLNNLLMWSMQQSGQIQMQPAEHRLYDLVEENFILLTPQAQQKGVHMKNDVPREVTIYADLQMILLVIRNLLSNAIKFTDKDGVVSVGAQEEAEQVTFWISDTGTGIDQENIDRLFSDELFTTQGTAKEKGTGLGLKLCKDFIDDNGGNISVESQWEKGTTFTIHIPNRAPYSQS
jgi:signal transduction histidine kinase